MKHLFSLIILFLFALNTTAQVGISTDNSQPDASAILDVKSTTKGMLVPRMDSTQRVAISSPATGLLVFDTSNSSFWFYNGTAWTDLSATTSSDHITDADNDTKIQVEESADEDIIRFDMAGTEFIRMDSGRIEVVNTGNSIFIGEGAGANDDFTNNQNVAIGSQALYSNTMGYQNVASGDSALYSNTVGFNNVAIGTNALESNTSGENNVAVGTQALYNNTYGSQNTASGAEALYNNTNGGHNVASGTFALRSNITGWQNVAVGNQAMYNNTEGTQNTASGASALSSNTTGWNNVASGMNALKSNTTGTFNTGIGFNVNVSSGNLTNATAIGANAVVSQDSSLVLGNAANVGIGTSSPDAKLHVVGDVKIVDGNEGAGKVLTSDANGIASWQAQAVDTLSLIADADNDTKIQVEESGDEDIIRFDMAGTEYFRMENGRLNIKNNGNSVFIGEQAGLADDHTNNRNVFIGFESGLNNTFGEFNSGVGAYSLQQNTTGYNNTAFGTSANVNNTSGGSNVAIGKFALFDNETGSYNVAVGADALEFGGSADTKNVGIGYEAGYLSIGNSNVYIGHQAGKNSNGSNRLIIANGSAATPLIYGEFDSGKVGIGTSSPDTSAMLDINSTTKGLLIPRMSSTQRTAISSPATGLMVFDTTSSSFWFYSGTAWTDLSAGGDHDFYEVGTTTAPNSIADNIWTQGSFAFGNADGVPGGAGSEASGSLSIAGGFNSVASGGASLAIGDRTTATRDGATALGLFTIASGLYSTAMGNTTTASGNSSTAMGRSTTASGLYSTAMGNGISAIGQYSFGIGLDNSLTDSITSGNTMAIMGGNVGIGTTAPQYPLDVNGTIQGDTVKGTTANITTINGTTANIQTINADLMFCGDGFTAAFGTFQDDGLFRHNTMVGSNSGGGNVMSGEYNVAFGDQALDQATTGDYNTALGAKSLQVASTGNYNTAVGYLAGQTSTFSNSAAIGANTINTASNQVRVGDNAVTSIGGFAAWSNVSDGRFKKNIRSNVAGLDFIMELRPVTYHMDLDAMDEFFKKSDEEVEETKAEHKAIIEKAKAEKEAILYTGFIAQEVEEAAQKLDFDFSGVDAPKNENDHYSLRYSEFVVPLVQAIQEQQQIIEDLKLTNEVLQTKVEAIDNLRAEHEVMKAQLETIDELHALIRSKS